jgi:hypothetical protein
MQGDKMVVVVVYKSTCGNRMERGGKEDNAYFFPPKIQAHGLKVKKKTTTNQSNEEGDCLAFLGQEREGEREREGEGEGDRKIKTERESERERESY